MAKNITKFIILNEFSDNEQFYKSFLEIYWNSFRIKNSHCNKFKLHFSALQINCTFDGPNQIP